MIRRPPRSTPFPTRRSSDLGKGLALQQALRLLRTRAGHQGEGHALQRQRDESRNRGIVLHRSEEHTSELQSLTNLVCRLLLEKKKIKLIEQVCTTQQD